MAVAKGPAVDGQGPLVQLERSAVIARSVLQKTEALESSFRSPIILSDPDLDTLRGDPEFEALVEEVRRRL